MTFHGWLHIELNEVEEEDGEQHHQRSDVAISLINGRIAEVSDTISRFSVERGGNGMIVLIAHGLRNHRNEDAVGLFRWAAAEYPESFGLLHIWDDEHSEYHNEFRVFRCARGHCSEMPDPHLSPCVPTIEVPSA
ncbi:MAG: Imm7 family immunity protein [Roseibacillus sp.]